MKVLAATAVALALATPGLGPSVRYLEARQVDGGGFAERGGRATPGLTAWAVLGLRAAGKPAPELESARAYLVRSEPELATVTDVELAIVARAALGDYPEALIHRVHALVHADGRIGPTVNSTAWGVLALRAAGEAAPPVSIRYLRRAQRRSGGWAWHPRGAPDSNDTASVIQALRSVGVKGAPIRRGLAFLRRHQNRDGGFELVAGRGSDVQSTAWAIQAFVAAGVQPGRAAFRYLERMRRRDGSFRYSARYAATPVWVTSQALAALARKPLPLPPKSP